MLNVLFGIGDEIEKDLNIVTWLKELYVQNSGYFYGIYRGVR